MQYSEREKMLQGELYLASDPELTALRLRARQLLGFYNGSGPHESEYRQQLLADLFGNCGAGSEIEPPFFCDYGSQIYAGERVYFNFGCVILDCARVEIGDDLLCGPQVKIFTATHPTEPDLRRQKLEYAKPIRIGSNVWLGGGTIICPGVTIGDNAVIGAGSVVVRDIPADTLAVGNPCRPIRVL